MKEVQDRVVQFSNRYKLTEAGTGTELGTYDFEEVTGTVTEAGTEINKALFDSIAEDFTAIINGTQPVGAVGAIQLTNEDIHSLVGAEHWGKTYFALGGNSVTNKPAGVDGFVLEVLRVGMSSTSHRLTTNTDSSGESTSPNIYIEQYISSWSSWQEVVTADGSYPTLGAGYLARGGQLYVPASGTPNSWYQVATIPLSSLTALSSSGGSYSCILLVNGVNPISGAATVVADSGILEIDCRVVNSAFSETPVLKSLSGNLDIDSFCVTSSTTNVNIYIKAKGAYECRNFVVVDERYPAGESNSIISFSQIYYGTTPPTGAIYAVVRNNASYADTAETLTEPFTVGKDTTTATTGYVKFASVRLPAAYRSASARFEVLDKNPVNAQTNVCGVEVVVKNTSTTNVDVVPRLLYGSSAYLSKIYACVKKGSYPVLVDLYFDITSSNPQESISCIKPLFTFGRTTVGVEFTFIADNEQVSALPTDTTNTQLSTVRVLVTEAADSAKLNGKAASEYALKSDIKTRISSTKKSVYPYKWEPKTWNGFTGLAGSRIWTDGENVYYSSGTSQYVLNRKTSTWTEKVWNGLTSLSGSNIWTDGENVYYSSGTDQYVLNRETSTWEPKTWNGLISFLGNYIWTDGENVYYSSGTDQYVLNRKTSTWTEKVWNGLTSLYGDSIWTDGENIYYSYSTNQYVLNRETSTWETKTWNGLTSFNGSHIWTDGENIYYSLSRNDQYKLAKVIPTTKTTLRR